MISNNQIPIEVNKKPFETVYELKTDYEVKKSPLSPAARSKVIKKTGSDYVSETTDDLVPSYGPCNDYDCTHTFYLKLTIGYIGFWGANGYYFTEGSRNNITSYTMNNIYQARNLLRKFHTGSVWVCNQVGAASNNTRRKNDQATQTLESWINVFENGQSVSQTIGLGR